MLLFTIDIIKEIKEMLRKEQKHALRMRFK